MLNQHRKKIYEAVTKPTIRAQTTPVEPKKVILKNFASIILYLYAEQNHENFFAHQTTTCEAIKLM